MLPKIQISSIKLQGRIRYGKVDSYSMSFKFLRYYGTIQVSVIEKEKVQYLALATQDYALPICIDNLMTTVKMDKAKQ